jgi:hypothetical protein
MNAIRCCGLMVIVLLGACDAQQAPAPKPKVAVEKQVEKPAVIEPVAEAPVTAVVAPPPPVTASPVTPPAPPAAPVHALKPNISVVPVVAKAGAAREEGAKAVEGKPATLALEPSPKAPAALIPPPKTKAGSTLTLKRETPGKKTVVANKEVTKDTRLSAPKLDLSLPPELASQLTPTGTVKPSARKTKPLLPQMFGDKDGGSDRGPFELNGRLLSNEMQLQMRNDNRRDVEGAALDFKFKQ